jgi:pilus assembly protein Flp/PilA
LKAVPPNGSKVALRVERVIAMRARGASLRLPREQRGVTAIEYAILAGIIASALVIVLGLLGTELAAMFDKIVAAFG